MHLEKEGTKKTGNQKESIKWEVLGALSLITQIGLTLILCMSISLFIGYCLDHLFGTRFIILIMMFIGIGASIRSLIMLTRTFIHDKEPTDKEKEMRIKMEDRKSGDSKEKSV